MNVLFNNEKLRQLQTNLYELTGVQTNIWDITGKNVQLFGEHSRFCRIMNDDPEGHRRCEDCDYKAMKVCMERRQAYTYKCHAGLRECVLPVFDSGEIIADIAHEKGIESVFHRAIDVVPDWKEALDMLIDLKISRVLTSGLEYDVSIATDTVREMIDYAAGRIQVMPGAGITARNMERVIRETGAEQIHLACHKLMFDHSTANNRAIYYGGCLYPPEDQFKVTDRDTVAGMVQRLG